MYTLIAGLVALPLFYIVIDRTDIGPKIKSRGSQALEKIIPPRVEIVEKIVEVPVEKIVEIEVPADADPLPDSYVAPKEIDVAKLWNGIPVETKLNTKQGKTATAERERDGSYQISLQVDITVPKANQTVDDLAELNPNLPKILPELPKLIKGSKVSGFYHRLYELKQKNIQQNVTRLNKLLSRHNFFDCESILEITHPDTQNRVLLMQGEMDVVSDGSDGDRVPSLDDYISMSPHYQPFTSYGWPKQTNVPNPVLARWEENLAKYEKEFAIKGLPFERNMFLQSQIKMLKPGIADMKGRSFLIAEYDPFVVIPLSMLGRTKESKHAPAIGDYCVVIHEDKIYPAIAGDAGPSYKMGEASLRLAREINEEASPYSRPVSDLKVTYLVFPGSADEKKQAPNYAAWRDRCATLVEGIGGLGEGYELHDWRDLIAEQNAAREAEAAAAKAAKEAAEAAKAAAEAAAPEEEESTTEEEKPATESTAELDAPAVPRTENE